MYDIQAYMKTVRPDLEPNSSRNSVAQLEKEGVLTRAYRGFYPTVCDCPTPECDHAWEWVSDWEGDPTLYNGTHDLSRFECELCGEQREWHDPRMRKWREDRQPQYEKDDR